ncbi:uncharacterized protein LOC113294886 [Papaver somniferum]|uniref:uncharacterized protein LOC113294886 n=1 Tax=Papaver somniferum TaxID=3469 RepID=UPI000E7003D2|nr:uncharacterized protein LOC113294886 [Papaver somniferum]
MEINNGKTTKIWVDRWVISHEFKLEPLHPYHLQYEYVCELIIQGTNSWNVPFLNDLFIPEVVNKIVRIQLSVTEEDVIKWMPSKDGNFTVKSAYNKLMEPRIQNQIAISVVPQGIWKSLWKMKLPHRVKLFIWKCLKDIVPTRVCLSQDMNPIDVSCAICNSEAESLYHLLVLCNHAKEVWRILNVNIDRIIINYHSIREWIMSWFQGVENAGDDDLKTWRSLLMVGCWIIWKERCDCVFQDKSLNPTETASRINYTLLSYKPTIHNSIDAPPEITQHDNNLVTHVPSDTFTIYADASYDELTNDCGTGMVLCNIAGKHTGIKGTYAAGILDAKSGECMAIREALSWAKGMDLEKIQIISDYEIVVKTLNNVALLTRWENRKLFRDIKQLSTSFQFCHFSFIRRDENQIADLIAKKVRKEKIVIEDYSSTASGFESLLSRNFNPETP